VTREYPANVIYDSVTEARVNALGGFGFTERQREFLVTVMVHSGCFLERQYCASPGLCAVRTAVSSWPASWRAASLMPSNRAGPARAAVPCSPQAAVRGDRPGGQPKPAVADDWSHVVSGCWAVV
jgi:hypothetical protein